MANRTKQRRSSGLTLTLYQRLLHPELFNILASEQVSRRAYDADIWLVEGGHVISFSAGKNTLTEVIVNRNDPVTDRGLIQTIPCRGERYHEMTSGENIKYMISTQEEQLNQPLYDATRSEVRAVLSSLAERGIVEYVTNRGFRVFDRTPEEINDIIEMIVALEGAAAPSMAANADDASIAELTRMAEQFDALITEGSHADLRLLNYRFHSRLNALGGNALMARTVQNLRECCISGPFGRYTTYQGLRASASEHFAIIDALKAHDGERLTQLLREHSSHTS